MPTVPKTPHLPPKATEDKGLRALMTKAALVDEIDSLLPVWLIQRVASSWFPPYIHVLRANPSTVSNVKLDAAWPVKDVTDYDGTSSGESTTLASSGGIGGGGGAGTSGAGRGGMKPVMSRGGRGGRGSSAGHPGRSSAHPGSGLVNLAVDGGLNTVTTKFLTGSNVAVARDPAEEGTRDVGLSSLVQELVRTVAALQTTVEEQAGRITALTAALQG